MRIHIRQPIAIMLTVPQSRGDLARKTGARQRFGYNVL